MSDLAALTDVGYVMWPDSKRVVGVGDVIDAGEFGAAIVEEVCEFSRFGGQRTRSIKISLHPKDQPSN